jgi:hypothetical protein
LGDRPIDFMGLAIVFLQHAIVQGGFGVCDRLVWEKIISYTENITIKAISQWEH